MCFVTAIELQSCLKRCENPICGSQLHEELMLTALSQLLYFAFNQSAPSCCFFVLVQLLRMPQREPDVIQPFQQAELAERIDLEARRESLPVLSPSDLQVKL